MAQGICSGAKIRQKPALVIASYNRGKILELTQSLCFFPLQITHAADWKLEETPENGTDFCENAQSKAQYVAQQSGQIALGDDSGLCVAALGGAPGIYSARYAGKNRDFAAAMARIYHQLPQGGTETKRAWFVCCLSLASPDGQVANYTGRVGGHLVWPPRGTRGFGYDAFFVPHGRRRTFGEMDARQKHGWSPVLRPGLSHRARAFDRLARHCLGFCPDYNQFLSKN